MGRMWKLVIGVILTVVYLHAQPLQDLLLPQPRHITGVVIDAEAKPIANAHIDHTDDRRQAHQTDSEGRFELDTRAPVVIIRKSGFRSELVRTRDATKARITLEKLNENRLFPTCSNNEQYDGIDGWGASFQFPRVSGIIAGRQGRDADYAERSYYVETTQGPRGIMHGSGPTWS